MVVLAVVLLFIAAIAASALFTTAVVNWGVIPLVIAFGGPDLPFWPTFIVTFVVLSLIGSIANRTLTLKENS